MSDIVVRVHHDLNSIASVRDKLSGDAEPSWYVEEDLGQLTKGDRVFFQTDSALFGYAVISEAMPIESERGITTKLIWIPGECQWFGGAKPKVTPITPHCFAILSSERKQISGSFKPVQLNMSIGRPTQTYICEVLDEDGRRRDDIQIMVKTNMEAEVGKFFELQHHYRFRMESMNSNWTSGPIGSGGINDA